MRRRDFLAGSAAVATLPLAGCDDYGAANMPRPPEPKAGPDGQRLLPWQNWSGYQSSLPSQRIAPETETAGPWSIAATAARQIKPYLPA